MEGRILPPVVARLGLEFRPRPPGLEEANESLPVEPRRTANDGDSNRRVPNRTRMRNSKRLTHALSNKRARRWAMHEFFYSDLDKEWYQNDGFVSDLAKLGFPIDARTRLTREEWFLVRRKLRKRPRRFSKRFIADELHRRNRHRALLRSLQRDPTEKEFAPIAAGTPVTAYDQRRQTIRRGRILMHDPKKHCYLVQFHDKDSGCEVCPDFEVAVSSPVTKARGKTATPPPLYEPHPEFSSSKVENEDIAELVIPKGIANGERTEDIERELLISSIAFAAEAFERKKAILEALESCTDNLGEGTSKQCSRLLWNLDRVNTTLKAALAYLQVLYGRVYGSSASNEEASESKIEPMKLSAPIPNSKEFEEMVTSLVSVSNKIGDLALSSGCKDTKKSSFSSSDLLRDHVSGSTSLLLLANYLAETSSSLAASGVEETTYSSAMDAALKTLLDRYSTHCLPPTKENLLVGKRLERDSRVEEELKDLWVAIGMLRTETALATDETRTFELRNAMV